jgi:predicted enzyme related to lactoylglutathione lyase
VEELHRAAWYEPTLMERVSGIGGVFFRSQRPKELAAWYAEHLGLAVEEWNGAVLRSSGAETLVWAIFPADTTYFGASGQHAMVNYRVGDLDALLEQLRDAGVEVEGPVDDENGRFGWGTDSDGNRFELWQPRPGA